MEKAEILQLFLKHGVQVDKEALEYIEKNPHIIEHVIKINKANIPPVITTDFLHILNDSLKTAHKLSTNDLSQILNYRYAALQEMISSRPEMINLVSINKISENLKQFSVIGVVSEKNDILKLEDSTGQADFIINTNLSKHIVEDEVIGILCENHRGINKVESVIYPDMPLKRDINKTKTPKKCLFLNVENLDEKYYKNLSDLIENQKDLTVFLFGDVTKSNQVKEFLRDARHTIQVYSEEQLRNGLFSTQIESMSILVANTPFIERYKTIWSEEIDETIMNLLKKRNLNPILTPEFYNNYFLLEGVPDIMVLNGIQTTAVNYKGTTVLTLNNSERIYWLINLETRETFKIEFS